MSEPDMTLAAPAPKRVDTRPSYAAVGIPQGVIVDRASGEIAWAVRRGGELVSLGRVEYGLWTILLTPMTLSAATEAASNRGWGNLDHAIARLGELDLLVTIEPGKAMGTILERLRPLPLGLGLGNGRGDPARFEIQNAALSLPTPVSLDVVAILFWWEFDGTRSLREIAAHVAAQVPGLSIDRADAVVTQLAYGLMASRLLYLDHPVPAGSK
jgi:hypothetical protein